MGNYLTIEALCVSHRIHEVRQNDAAFLLLVLSYLADKDGAVMFDRSEIIDTFGIRRATFQRAMATLIQSGAVIQLRRGRSGTAGWRRIYKLTGAQVMHFSGVAKSLPLDEVKP